MHFSTLFTTTTVALISLADITSAHVVLVDAYGNANKQIRGYALGFDAGTPRKGGYLYPQQRDITVFANKVVHGPHDAIYQPNGCGTTLQHTAWYYQKHEKGKWFGVSDAKRQWLFKQVTPHKGFIDIPAGIGALAWHEWKKNTRKDLATGRTGLRNGIPKVSAGGTLSVLAYQINLDGGGHFKCKIDYQANGKQWRHQLTFKKNCPGDAQSFNWPGVQKSCWFTVNIPKDLNCQGKTGSKNEVTDICLIRCENSAKNGPFGGCIPIQQMRPKPKPKPAAKPKTPPKPQPQAKPKPKTVISVKKVPVTVVKTVKASVAPLRPVTVTKNKVITIVQGGRTRVHVPVRNEVITVVQVINPITKTVVETQFKTVTVEEPAPSQVSGAGKEEEGENKEEEEDKEELEEVPDDNNPENDDANKPQPKPKDPTPEEIKAALQGEDYPDEAVEEKISGKEKEAIKEEAEKGNELPDEVGQEPEGDGYF
ncbi:hypothetical protein TWF718_009052 [Orbilia javanica]|uniref:Uncharacterized protein n=1 Tax=Orbilia javanica TaxID=47235 RepID=A0AAN8MUC8_9PEZI